MPAGRPRKPTATKILEGDQPCRINRNEPKPAGGVGRCPDHLDHTAQLAWARLVKILEAMKVLTSADAEALAFYCVNYSLWTQAHVVIADEGLTVPTQFSTKPHPMLSVALNAEKQMTRVLAQFGMTPAARSSLNLGGKEEDDEFDKYVKEKQARKNGPTKAQKSAHPARAGEVDQD